MVTGALAVTMLFLTSSVGVGLDLLGLGVVNTVNGVDGALVVGGGAGLGLGCVLIVLV